MKLFTYRLIHFVLGFGIAISFSSGVHAAAHKEATAKHKFNTVDFQHGYDPLDPYNFDVNAGSRHKKAQHKKPAAAPQTSLYKRLGGKAAIIAVVDDFVGNVAADRRINAFFAKTNIDRLKRLLVEQICAGSGGPCTYTGRDMKTAHFGMGVQAVHFNALVEDLIKTLDKFGVPEQEKNELLGILGPMQGDIVQG